MEKPRDGAVHHNILPSRLLFCLNLGVNAAFLLSIIRSPLRPPSTEPPPNRGTLPPHRLQVLVRYFGGVCPSAVPSLPPRPHQSTWWSAHYSDKAFLNGIRSPRPWRTGSVINHSVFSNTTLCWCRLEVQMCICVYGVLSFQNTVDLQLISPLPSQSWPFLENLTV